MEELVENVLALDGESTRRLEQLYRITNRIVDLPTETDIYDHAIDATHELFDIRYAVIVIPREERWMTIASTHSGPGERIRKVPITSSEVEAAIERHEAVLVDDVASSIDNEVPFEGGQALCSLIGDERMLQLVADGCEFDAEDVRDAVGAAPSTIIVTEVFAPDGACVDATEAIVRDEGSDETTVLAISIVRDKGTEMPQIGVSAVVPERGETVAELTQTILGVGTEDAIRVVVIDTTATDEPLCDVPSEWSVTTATDLEAAETALAGGTYNLAVLWIDGRTGRERDAVRTLRERRGGRRVPVVLVDRGRSSDEIRYVLGGKRFIHRPLNVSDLTSILVSSPGDDRETGSSNQ